MSTAPVGGAGETATTEVAADPGPRRLGEPIELPWWAPVAVLPPLLCLGAGLVLGAPLELRLVDIVASALMVWVVTMVSTHVQSRNMQSVWVSAAYAVWVFPVLIWAVAAWPPHLFR